MEKSFIKSDIKDKFRIDSKKCKRICCRCPYGMVGQIFLEPFQSLASLSLGVEME